MATARTRSLQFTISELICEPLPNGASFEALAYYQKLFIASQLRNTLQNNPDLILHSKSSFESYKIIETMEVVDAINPANGDPQPSPGVNGTEDTIVNVESVHNISPSTNSGDTFARTRANEVIVAGKDVSWLEVLPFELREQVFQYIDDDCCSSYPSCLCDWDPRYFSWMHSNPNGVAPLVQALQDSPMAYDHVLQWFDQSCSEWPIRLNVDNGFDVSDMTDCEAMRINYVKLDLPPNWETTLPRVAINVKHSHALASLPSLEEITIELGPVHTWKSAARYALTDWVCWLRSCRRLKRVVVQEYGGYHSIYRQGTERLSYGRIVDSVIEKVSGRLGIPEKQSTLNNGLYVCTSWEAKEGEFLDFDWGNDHLFDWDRACSRDRRWNFFNEPDCRAQLKFLGGTFVIEEISSPCRLSHCNYCCW